MNKKNTALLMGACLLASTASFASTPNVNSPSYTLTIQHVDLSTLTTENLADTMRAQLGSVCGIGESYGQGNKTDGSVDIQCAPDEVWSHDLSLELPTTNGNVMDITISYNADNTWSASAPYCTLLPSQLNEYTEFLDHSC